MISCWQLYRELFMHTVEVSKNFNARMTKHASEKTKHLQVLAEDNSFQDILPARRTWQQRAVKH